MWILEKNIHKYLQVWKAYQLEICLYCISVVLAVVTISMNVKASSSVYNLWSFPRCGHLSLVQKQNCFQNRRLHHQAVTSQAADVGTGSHELEWTARISCRDMAWGTERRVKGLSWVRSHGIFAIPSSIIIINYS